jgi:thioredoxin reductase (NADPH)
MSPCTDAIVIGAGPVGLFQVFQLGLLGLKAELIDVLPEAGGQCVALYPEKPIYDVPGVPVCTGRELTRLLLAQAAPFLPPDADTGRPCNLHLGHLVSEVSALPEGGYRVATAQGLVRRARALFIAAGAGAFVPKTLALPGLDAAPNVHHHLPDGTPPGWVGQHLIVSGGGDEALQAVIDIAGTNASHRPARLSLLHRRDQFQADPALDAAVRTLIAQGQVDLIVGMPGASQISPQGTLSALDLLGADGQTRTQPLDHLLIRQGMSPKLGALTQWGMALERKQVAVSPSTFESSLPQVYAVGDINTYPGKKRLLLCGFHEATLAAHAAAAALRPDAPQHLLYTTTSPLLHERLGLL